MSTEEVEKKPFQPNAQYQVDVQTGGIAKKPEDNDEANDVSKAESGEAPKPYPKVVFLIVLNELCERFSYYGLRTVLFIYLTKFWFIPNNTATAVYHAFAMLCYFSPLAGAILADGYIGLYNTILYVSIFYLLGEVVLAVTSITPIADLTPGVPWGPAVGLIIIALGTGGIKPCVSAFGGNQFHPSQKRYLENFFSVFYLSINVGSLISTIVTPIFRSDIYCFGKQCYPLAFGVPALVMAIGIVCFAAGTPYYVRAKATGKNVIVETCKVFYLAFKNWLMSWDWRWARISKCQLGRKSGVPKKDHWLDYAGTRYSVQMIKDVKAVWKVLIVLLPIPVFWALYDQQGSRWTEQAQQLNGKLGSITIKPDQFQAINPIFVVILVPIFDLAIYPALAKFNLFTKLLTRMAMGLIFGIAAFCVAAVLESQMQSAWADLNRPGQLRIVNLSPCNFTLAQGNFDFELHVDQAMLGANKFHNVPTGMTDKFFAQQESVLLQLAAQCPPDIKKPDQVIVSKENLPKSLIFYIDELNQIQIKDYWYNQKDGIIGSSQMRARSFNTEDYFPDLGFRLENKKTKYSLDVIDIDGNQTNSTTTPVFTTTESIETTEAPPAVKAGGGGNTKTDPTYTEIDFNEYDLHAFDSSTGTNLISGKYELETCARYTVLLFVNRQGDEPALDFVILTDIYQNGVSLFWQLFQIFVMTIGEIMFSISGLAFAYSQAPPSMKSVLQSIWQLTVAFGNLIVVIIAEAKMVDNQTYEYLIFAGLLGLATIAFGILGYFYKYEEDEDSKEESSGETSTSSVSLPPAYEEKEAKTVRMSDIKDE